MAGEMGAHGGDVCGGETKDGGTCTRAAGWGTDADSGPCRDHIEDYVVPKKLTPEVQSTLIGAAQEGAFKIHCAAIAGITEQTLRNWLDWGREDIENDIDSPLAELYLEFQRARGAGAVRHLQNADSEFVLERSYGYTKTEKHDVDMNAQVGLDPSEAYVEALKAHEAAKAKDHPASNTDGPGRTL